MTLDLAIARAEMGAVLRAAFPDPRVQITAELVDAAIRALPERVQESAFGEVMGLALGEQIPAIEGQHVVGYYLAHATHERHGVHRFTGHFPMVRVLLPREQEDISTAIGIVFAGDHRLDTLDRFVEHYRELLDFRPARVELTTPARYLGARFAAVATYAAFDDAGALRAWVLEAGMATGEPMVLFCSPNGAPIDRTSWYTPTPFSSDRHRYQGRAEFRPDGAPETLRVDVLERAGASPHLTVSVRYDALPAAPDTVFPARLTLEAACRVAAIAERLGKPVPGAELLAPILAALGRELSWEVQP